MLRLHEIVVLRNCIRRKTECNHRDQVRRNGQPYEANDAVEIRSGETDALPCDETTVHPGNAPKFPYS